jgi:hypothetical protein
MAITNEYGDTTIVTAHDNKMMEWLARGIAIRMGGCAYIAEYSMDGATAKRTSIHGTISLGIRIGRCLREARERHLDPFNTLIEMLKDTPYRYGRVIFEGKVADIFRRTTEGFANGCLHAGHHANARGAGGVRAASVRPRSRLHPHRAVELRRRAWMSWNRFASGGSTVRSHRSRLTRSRWRAWSGRPVARRWVELSSSGESWW